MLKTRGTGRHIEGLGLPALEVLKSIMKGRNDILATKRGKLVFAIVCILAVFAILFPTVTSVHAATPKSKFYDFSEQLIDGQIKKPTSLYTDARQKVKFDRLLKLKKSFLPSLFNTAKEKVFK